MKKKIHNSVYKLNDNIRGQAQPIADNFFEGLSRGGECYHGRGPYMGGRYTECLIVRPGSFNWQLNEL